MSKKDKQRFVWDAGDVTEVAGAPIEDHRKMSEAEKAYFLKQQKKK
jgi:hypothetical protein